MSSWQPLRQRSLPVPCGPRATVRLACRPAENRADSAAALVAGARAFEAFESSSLVAGARAFEAV